MSKAKLNIKVLLIILVIFIVLTLVITTNLLNSDKKITVTDVKGDKSKIQSIQSDPTGDESELEVEFEEKLQGPLIQ